MPAIKLSLRLNLLVLFLYRDDNNLNILRRRLICSIIILSLANSRLIFWHSLSSFLPRFFLIGVWLFA